jgi:anti-anti-sigma factor
MDATSHLDIDVDRRPDATVVTLRGELDLGSVPDLDRALDTLTAEDLVLDLRALDYLDSAGVRLLLERHSAVRALGRRLTIVHGGEWIERVFTLTDTSRLLPLVASG